MLTGANRKGSVVRGDIFVVDEDTDLLDPTFHTGGQVNPQWKPPRNGPKGNQKGKPEVSSKHLDENITTEKKMDSSGRTSSLFPGKPSDDIIELDTGSTAKKPSVGFPLLPRVPADPRTSANSSKLRNKTDNLARTVSPPHVVTSDPAVVEQGERNTTQSTTDSNNSSKHNGKQPDRERPGTVTVVSVDGDLVRSSDGKTYRLQRGPPGRMGPPGQEVSGLVVPLLIQRSCSDLLFTAQVISK